MTGRTTFLEDEPDLDERLSQVAGRKLEGLDGEIDSELVKPEPPERVINPSDIKIIYMTEKGQEAFRKGIPFLKMIEGEDYTIPFIIDYKVLVRQRVKDDARAYHEYKRPRYSFKEHNTYAKSTAR